MSEPGPLGDDPFANIPFLGDLMRLLGQQGSFSWEAARQLAHSVATEGRAEPNIDPAVRFHYQQLARVAELHVQQATGLDLTMSGRSLEVVPVTPSMWAHRTLEAYRPLFEQLSSSLGSAGPAVPPADAADLMSSLVAMMAPTMVGLGIGTMVGQLARRSFGQYDLPIPRPPSHELLVVPHAIDGFADDWSLPPDDLKLWVCVHELTSHAVLAVPHVRDELQRLLARYAGGFRPDTTSFDERLDSLNMTGQGLPDLQRLFGDPSFLLGAVRTTEQQGLLVQLDALVAVIVGYVDHVLDGVSTGLVGSAGRISEAVRRRRLEDDQSAKYVGQLLGMTITQSQVERGARFVGGIVERAGDDSLGRLWRGPRELPTPAEVDAPGLWLARIELPD
ncbi:MAG TPA: zinc-dependent metalloprotease [Acidimicrobiales bacterium]